MSVGCGRWLVRSTSRTRARPRSVRSPMRTLHHYQIDDVSLVAYDEAGSLSSTWVARELQADDYGLRDMRFEEGDVVVDVGAHVGLFVIYLAKRCPTLKLLAFEPFPANFRNC